MIKENKIVKRVGVFETNSSSCHSIVYTGKKGGKVNPDFVYGEGGYGWSGSNLDSPSDKLDYMIVYISNTCFQEEYLRNVIGVLRKKEGKDFVLKVYNTTEYGDFRGIIVEGLEVINDRNDGGGYIDHQSEYMLGDIFNSGDSVEKEIENFLYGKAVVLIDNDN